jgi:hypothetical protein
MAVLQGGGDKRAKRSFAITGTLSVCPSGVVCLGERYNKVALWARYRYPTSLTIASFVGILHAAESESSRAVIAWSH